MSGILDKITRSGRALFLAYDQGFEHGPTDFNDKNVDPKYIIEIAKRGKYTGVIFQKGIAEKYKSENIFFPGSQSVYVYNSLADFYTDANAYLNNTTSPVTLRRFQVRWSNQPGMEKPIQPLEVFYRWQQTHH